MVIIKITANNILQKFSEIKLTEYLSRTYSRYGI